MKDSSKLYVMLPFSNRGAPTNPGSRAPAWLLTPAGFAWLLGLVVDQPLDVGARRSSRIALADIAGDAHDLGAVPLAQPRNDDGGIEAARVGEDYFFNIAHASSNGGEVL